MDSGRIERVSGDNTAAGGAVSTIGHPRELNHSKEGDGLFDADDIMKLQELQKEVTLEAEDTTRGAEEGQKGSRTEAITSPERPPSRLSRFTGLNTFSPNFKSSSALFTGSTVAGMRKAVSSSHISTMDKAERSDDHSTDGTDDSTTTTADSNEKRSALGMLKSKSMMSFGKYQK